MATIPPFTASSNMRQTAKTKSKPIPRTSKTKTMSTKTTTKTTTKKRRTMTTQTTTTDTVSITTPHPPPSTPRSINTSTTNPSKTASSPPPADGPPPPTPSEDSWTPGRPIDLPRPITEPTPLDRAYWRPPGTRPISLFRCETWKAMTLFPLLLLLLLRIPRLFPEDFSPLPYTPRSSSPSTPFTSPSTKSRPYGPSIESRETSENGKRFPYCCCREKTS
mmetsp:Transcript_4209/g.8010  ORF Transcript_4209/g.8010 Transcript_4209/m.8010 type:complete len:220 (-) Transcript_4209:266-925(-)